MTEDASTAALMALAHRHGESQVLAGLAAHGFDDLTLAGTRLLRRMEPQGLRLTELASRAGVTKQTAGALVDVAERAGYLERRADPTDHRARIVVLTARGRALCGAAAAEVARVESTWRTHLGDGPYDALRSALFSLRDLAEPVT